MPSRGSVEKAVGGYSFEDAAKEAPGTKNFHSADGHLTFAIVTHTAGNGFFDPVYVGATVAGNMIGAKILLLGSESPVDDLAARDRNPEPDRPGSDDRRHDHDDAAGRRLQRHRQDSRGSGIPVATTNSFDPTIYDRDGISHTGQDASAAAIGGEALAKCVLDKGVDEGLDRASRRQTTAGQHRGQQPRHRGLQRDRQGAEGRRQARRLQGRRRSGERSASTPTTERSRSTHRVAVRVARRRGRRLRGQQRLHPGARQGGRADEHDRQDLRLRLRPRPGAAGRHRRPAT